MQRKVPHVLSLTDFMGWRFGYVAKSYVVLLCMFNMAIGEPGGAARTPRRLPPPHGQRGWRSSGGGPLPLCGAGA